MGAHASPSAEAAAHRILDDVRRIVQLLHESSRRTEGAVGLSAAQLFVLTKLAARPAMSINDLAKATLTHQSSVSVVAARLVARGLVRRRTSAEDARRVELALTPRGRAWLGDAPPTAQDRLVAGLASLRATDRAALARTLHLWVERVYTAGAVLGVPPMFFEDEKRARRSRGAKKGARRDAST
jgi:DNA-binding MarR family transcriptional regulator